MEILELLRGSPEDWQALVDDGCSEAQIMRFCDEISEQLGEDDFDITDVLVALDAETFAAELDLGKVAAQAGLTDRQVEHGVALLTPLVAAFKDPRRRYATFRARAYLAGR
ncbi:MAG: hypothetical protein AAF513_10920 [Pseudomonadota bacterium]